MSGLYREDEEMGSRISCHELSLGRNSYVDCLSLHLVELLLKKAIFSFHFCFVQMGGIPLLLIHAFFC